MDEHLELGPARPAVTVVIPTFNRASIVGRAIRSVLGQTCRDWELIVSVSLRCICEGWQRILAKYRNQMAPRTLAKHLSRVAILLFNYDPRRATI